MGYVDKYVKLKPEDFQLSLWGGDAVLNNLDLRLDVIEKAIQLPIVFKSGHIHEIRLHVPWTKLGSEPIVVTINTIECILKLRDTAYDGDNSSRSAAEKAKSKSPQVRARTRRQDAGDIPPGYLQSVMNKITNNLSIIVNNLIIKFVEDDIVLSINMKSAEVYSVDELWNRAFIDLSPPEFLLRKSINFCDLTVCLDKCNSSDPENPEPTSPKEDDVGWAQWAWSYVPQILPSEEEELLQETKPKKKHEPLILSVGMYAHKITLVFKLTEKIREKVHYGPQKVAFRPFMLLEGEGIALEILVQGLLFFDVQFGVTNMLLTSQGQCICGAEDKDDQKSNNILIGGDNLQTKVSSNYYTHSLFDVNCPANQKEPLQFVLDGKTHRQINTEQHGMQRFGVFWLDYLYVLEQTQKEGHEFESYSFDMT
ncbi:hypothetical protein KUTeg_000683 [Tegillarca granosa]|uniref:Chorein N-terminal domain-containing protein n=1 Tax=Tegillarca granosa TaxID=220873 RepID=A0ABQ9G1N3_TEGGR|nr:hypothetical protein KUTeg_000683 [Tegillarca granosa]